MYKSLSDRLSGIFDRLKGRGSLSEDDVNAAMREIRLALVRNWLKALTLHKWLLKLLTTN